MTCTGHNPCDARVVLSLSRLLCALTLSAVEATFPTALMREENVLALKNDEPDDPPLLSVDVVLAGTLKSGTDVPKLGVTKVDGSTMLLDKSGA